MAKSKAKTAGEIILDKLIGEKVERDFSILEASIKDDFCNYQFEVTHGVGIGDRHGVKGSGIVMDSLKEALAELNVHIAVIDDVFKNAGIEKDIEELKNHEFTYLYAVTGFKVKNNSILLSGSKYISTGGRISFETPRISIDELSAYKWYNELKEASDKIREEVALYKEGNYIAVAEEEEKEDPGQMKMTFVVGTEDNMSDFESAAQ